MDLRIALFVQSVFDEISQVLKELVLALNIRDSLGEEIVQSIAVVFRSFIYFQQQRNFLQPEIVE
jgi:hypothetical protein